MITTNPQTPLLLRIAKELNDANRLIGTMLSSKLEPDTDQLKGLLQTLLGPTETVATLYQQKVN